MRSIVVDSGFLIGLFDEADPLHARCREFVRDYRGRFLTTEAVLTEALALLSKQQRLRCLTWLGDAAQAGLLVVDREALDLRAVEKLARKYADQPMDFADASGGLARDPIGRTRGPDRRPAGFRGQQARAPNALR